MAGTKVSSRKLRKSVKSRRRQRGGLPNFLSMFEARKAGEPKEEGHSGEDHEEHSQGVTSPLVDGSSSNGEGSSSNGEGSSKEGFMGLGLGGRRRRRASRRVRRGRRTARRTARRVRRSRRRSNRRK
tara:strand:- start:153 stop:533 length:381 start_codon:yes stop_codon:yes gene_type:complete